MSLAIDYLLFSHAMTQDTRIQITARNLTEPSTTVFAESPCSMGGIFVGNCVLGAFSNIGAGSEVHGSSIGRFSSIAPDVLIGLSSEHFDLLHGVTGASIPKRSSSALSALGSMMAAAQGPRTTIGNDVKIGRGAVIKEGVTVGDGAVIGEEALVAADVLPYQVVLGRPARPSGFRFEPDVIDRLLRLAWWRYDLYSLALHGFEYSNSVAMLSTLEHLALAERLQLFEPLVHEITRASVNQAFEQEHN